jgi:hypothetical protein
VPNSKQALSERAEGGSINLDDLGPDSPLGTMLTLEALRVAQGATTYIIESTPEPPVSVVAVKVGD